MFKVQVKETWPCGGANHEDGVAICLSEDETVHGSDQLRHDASLHLPLCILALRLHVQRQRRSSGCSMAQGAKHIAGVCVCVCV